MLPPFPRRFKGNHNTRVLIHITTAAVSTLQPTELLDSEAEAQLATALYYRGAVATYDPWPRVRAGKHFVPRSPCVAHRAPPPHPAGTWGARGLIVSTAEENAVPLCYRLQSPTGRAPPVQHGAVSSYKDNSS
ncbi:unnamed protein product [Lota lota]